jgi:TolA-binding protein
LSSAQDATEIKVAHYATAASNLESRLALERRSLMAVANTASNLQSALSGQKQTVSQVKEEMTSRIRGQAGEIDQLRETITALEIENAMLQSNLKDYLGRTTIKEEEEDFSPPPLEPAAPQPATNIAVPAPAIPFRLPVP